MDALTVESRRNWDAVALGWARRRAQFAEVAAPVTEGLLSLLSPKPGERILELACGPGEVGLRVARLVGEDGHVLLTDLSPEMVEAARDRGGELGVTNADFGVLDAQDMALPDRAFDAAVCRFGYMLMPDPARGLRETARVVGGDGRLAFAVWADRRLNTWGTAGGRALVELGLAEPPAREAPGPFALDDPGRLQAAITSGGMTVVSEEDIAVRWSFPSVTAWWELMTDLSVSLQTGIAGLSEPQLEEVRRVAYRHLDVREEHGAVVVPGLARIILARPAR